MIQFKNKITIIQVLPRTYAPGTWVKGRIGSSMFYALVFAQHATEPSYELGLSKISKLELRLADVIEFSWDRGLVQPAVDAETEQNVATLCEQIAGRIYPS
jgi:hypothetical protein